MRFFFELDRDKAPRIQLALCAKDPSIPRELRSYAVYSSTIMIRRPTGTHDPAGKDARLPLSRFTGFKETAVGDFHQCLITSLKDNHEHTGD